MAHGFRELIVLAGALVSSACGSSFATEPAPRNEERRVQVTLHEGGVSRLLEAEAAAIEEELRACLAAVESVTRLAVDEERIEAVRAAQALELVFSAPRTFDVLGRPRQVRRLLVPLAGELGQDGALVFHGETDRYDNGPWKSSRSLTRLRTLAGETR